MKRVITCLILCAALMTGCRSTSSVIEVACKPQFELKPRPELIVTTRDGDQADASDQCLIILDGEKKYRIPWGTPPISHGPVHLSKHLTYTFKLDATGKAVLSVRGGDKLIYEAQK